MSRSFPFSAIVSQEQLKSALLVNAVDLSIGGVLIRGEKGTAKTTAVRALRAILPRISVVADCPYHCPPDDPGAMCSDCRARVDAEEAVPTAEIETPLVEVPLNATEDRLVGTLHIEQALETGRRRFEPGLLAEANRGILYVDEVNLLEDHLVDVLLDVAASGENIVEREGISVRHPARFILVGTMNPEEGELRPQLTDRFGLCVTVGGLPEPQQRTEVVKRWTEFERSPEAFVSRWEAEDERLSERISAARNRIGHLEVTEDTVHLAVTIAARAEVQGHRPDIVIVKTARALAALLGEPRASIQIVFEAARLVLSHRMQNALLRPAGETAEEIERVLRYAAEEEGQGTGEAGRSATGATSHGDGASGEPINEDLEDMQVPGSTAAGSILLSLFDSEKKKTSGPRLIRSSSDAASEKS